MRRLAEMPSDPSASRRQFLQSAGALAGAPWVVSGVTAAPAPAASPVASPSPVALVVNGQRHELLVEPRVTLLDALREHLNLTGTKKGCDRGQCGACTVLVNGRRINACLSLAVAHDGDAVVTIEGLGDSDRLHPMQAAFIEHDAFQCGYCTPGQICSAVALLDEVKRGEPSVVTASLAHTGAVPLTDVEVRERMSGNLCRCGAYLHIVKAVKAVAGAGR
jgi:xanthine dehydrogenase YagT iron-sulfur-binding subunit